MKEFTLARLCRIGVCVSTVVTPVIFWRGATDSFDLVKGVFLWVSSAVLVVPILTIRSSFKAKVTVLELALVLFLLAGVLSTAFSISPVTSLWGQSQRYTGLLTFGASCFFAIAVATCFNPTSLRPLLFSLVGAGTAVALYGALQEAERDPFQWSVTSFGKFVFGTMGNPNTASGLVSVSLPLAAWLVLNQETQRQLRVVGGAILGLMLGALASFDSFQGGVAALVTSLMVLIVVLWEPSFRNMLLGPIVAIGGVVIPNLGSFASGWLVLLSAFFFGALTFVANYLPVRQFATSWKRLGPALVALIVVVFALFGREIFRAINQGVSGGFVERGDFYRAARDVFKANPIVGSGVETFGFVFTEYRPAGHALRLEGSRTSSVHSVPLGMFSNGGLLLGLTYVAIFLVTLISLVRYMRNAPRNNRLIPLAVGAAWFASHIQGLVSVEHVALLSTQFVLTGAVWASIRQSSSNPKNSRRVSKVSMLALGLGTAGAVSVSAMVLVTPLRANVSSREGLVAAYTIRDGALALKKLSHAVELAGWEPLYRIQKVEVLVALGRIDDASLEASKAIELSRYNPAIGISLAKVVAAGGDYALASDYVESTVRSDPLAPSLRKQAGGFFAELGSVYLGGGDLSRAELAFEKALYYDPGNAVAQERLAKT